MNCLEVDDIAYPLTDNMKFWLTKLFDEEIEECSVASSNEHLWAIGSDGESAAQHEGNADELRDYVEILRALRSKVK